MAEPRRVLIDWDYCANGIWWVTTKEEMEAPPPPGRWAGTRPQDRAGRPRPWSEWLSVGLLDDLQEWNDAWDGDGWGDEAADLRALRERGRDLAVRVQDELGTEDWEVLYRMDGRVHRVHPPGSWPVGTWRQELLGYYVP
jgi:hypothetical protein